MNVGELESERLEMLISLLSLMVEYKKKINMKKANIEYDKGKDSK